MTGSWRDLDAIPEGIGPCAVTIGNFDGVHLGHRRILRSVAETARSGAMTSVALTFDPHPLRIVAPDQAPEALTGIGQRIELIREQGIDRVAVLPFTAELSRLSPEEFAGRVLVSKLAAKHVTVGENFRFGRGQTGNAATLKSLGARLGFEVVLAGTVTVDDRAVSSTRVRRLVRQGRIDRAAVLLGRVFSLRGPIVRGEGIGSQRTVPTLNLAPESEVLPADGVYVTATLLPGEDRCRESVTNVGMRPTFDGRRRTVETYLLGSLECGPPDAIELRFLRKIRDERRFPSAESLRNQIRADIEVAQRYFRRSGILSAQSSAVH